VLKGGVLLAAFDERRPTRDIDLQAQAPEHDTEKIRNARAHRPARYAPAVGAPNQVVRASESPAGAPSPTQAT
jgi:hypothetical protein